MSDLRTRLDRRLHDEEVVLLQDFPTAQLGRETNTVILPGYQLPNGWSHPTTDVLFVVPDNYPAGCPDNVCVRPDLRLANGQMPDRNLGVQSYVGREWLQLSWHIDSGGWMPTGDPSTGSNLASYLIGALARFDDPS